MDPNLVVKYDQNKTTKSTQLVEVVGGSIFDAARQAKGMGASFFAMSNMGGTPPSQGEIGADSVSTDKKRRAGTIYIIKDLSDVKKSGKAAQETVFKYGPEDESMAMGTPMY